MAQGKEQLKFERHLCNNFRDNRCHRRTKEKVPYHNHILAGMRHEIHVSNVP